MGRDEMLQSYVASLLASVTGTSAGADKRVIREVLAVVAALAGVATDDDGLLTDIGELVELGRQGLRRVLADLADAGLLEESGVCTSSGLISWLTTCCGRRSSQVDGSQRSTIKRSGGWPHPGTFHAWSTHLVIFRPVR